MVILKVQWKSPVPKAEYIIKATYRFWVPYFTLDRSICKFVP